jgi:hypothetical protein
MLTSATLPRKCSQPTSSAYWLAVRLIPCDTNLVNFERATKSMAFFLEDDDQSVVEAALSFVDELARPRAPNLRSETK